MDNKDNTYELLGQNIFKKFREVYWKL